MENSTGSAPKATVNHDEDFVDTDTYLREMAQRIVQLRSLLPTLADIAPSRSKPANAKSGNRRLKAGASL